MILPNNNPPMPLGIGGVFMELINFPAGGDDFPFLHRAA